MKVGYIQGVFDILHIGHLQCIKKCADNCDTLIVGIQHDKWVVKSKSKSILNTQERVDQMMSMCDVSGVVVYDDPQSTNMLELVKPDIFFYGGDWLEQMDRSIILDYCKKHKIKTKMITRYPDMTTSEIIKRIRER